LRILRGAVVRGAGRGKALGFPTANLDIPQERLPRSGIYAAWARIAGEAAWRPGAASVGFNPTFGEKTRRLEVHLLDFDGELYGLALEVVLAAFLREEKRFPGIEALKEQMRRDCRRARRILARSRIPDSVRR
jgi:riboflavin kinase/FMN adenylyltransferase